MSHNRTAGHRTFAVKTSAPAQSWWISPPLLQQPPASSRPIRAVPFWSLNVACPVLRGVASCSLHSPHLSLCSHVSRKPEFEIAMTATGTGFVVPGREWGKQPSDAHPQEARWMLSFERRVLAGWWCLWGFVALPCLATVGGYQYLSYVLVDALVSLPNLTLLLSL